MAIRLLARPLRVHWRRTERALPHRRLSFLCAAPALVGTGWNGALPVTGGLIPRRHLTTGSRETVADLLAVSKEFRSKQTHYIFEDQTVRDAVKSLAKNENSATLVVVDKDHKVVGLVTNHILLERIAKMDGKPKRRKSKRAEASAAPNDGSVSRDQFIGWDSKVIEIAIPAREILHVSPQDSVEDVRSLYW
jgi:hypothetical protein